MVIKEENKQGKSYKTELQQYKWTMVQTTKPWFYSTETLRAHHIYDLHLKS